VAVIDDLGSCVILEIRKFPRFVDIARIMEASFRTSPNRCVEKLSPIARQIAVAVIDDDLGSCVILEIRKFARFVDIARIMEASFRTSPNRCVEKLNPIARQIAVAVIDDDLGSCVILEI